MKNRVYLNVRAVASSARRLVRLAGQGLVAKSFVLILQEYSCRMGGNECRLAKDTDLEMLKGVRADLAPKLDHRIGRGDVCYVSVPRGRVVSNVFAATGTAEVFGTELRLKPDEAYIYDLYTLPGERRKGHGSRVIGSALADLAGMGITKFYVIVDDDNPGSLLMFERLGFCKIGEVLYSPVVEAGQLRRVLQGSRLKFEFLGTRSLRKGTASEMRRLFPSLETLG